jgi:hypothetical protein
MIRIIPTYVSTVRNHDFEALISDLEKLVFRRWKQIEVYVESYTTARLLLSARIINFEIPLLKPLCFIKYLTQCPTDWQGTVTERSCHRLGLTETSLAEFHTPKVEFIVH